MTQRIQRLNPASLHPTPGYSHVTLAAPGRTAHLAGQCPLDRTGAVVGEGDVLAQTDQVIANALTALDAAGARPEDVVRSVIYVVSEERDALAAVWRRLNASALAPAFTTASTLLGVARLGFTGQLVELDLTAALPPEPEPAPGPAHESEAGRLPVLVAEAQARAGAAGFPYACEHAVGRLLAVLAARVPEHGRVLEIGTGLGVGTAWLLSGLAPRTDVTLVTVERDAERIGLAAAGAGWPAFVRPTSGDVLELLDGLGTFDLIFADAEGGKHEGLDRVIAALGPRGTLVVDDMTPQPHWPADLAARQHDVRRAVLGHPDLVAVELSHGSGVILATRRAA
ncbi:MULTISPECIES: Rid family hydrolase [unclassified Nonomuraea]|uniref:Rid family hydrolase n=1 Tax=unclassified Nonomuraea TaxID=2593643 RepID=UPI0033D6917E